MDDDVAVVVGDEKQIPAPIRSETTLEDELVLDAPAQKTLNLYKVDNYTFGTKHSSQKQHERNPQRLKEKCASYFYSVLFLTSCLDIKKGV
jgi:hypothetical protein